MAHTNRVGGHHDDVPVTLEMSVDEFKAVLSSVALMGAAASGNKELVAASIQMQRQANAEPFLTLVKKITSIARIRGIG